MTGVHTHDVDLSRPPAPSGRGGRPVSAWEGLTPPYSTIVADPPWAYDGFPGSVGRGGVFVGAARRAAVQVKPLPYASMSVEQIAALPVLDLVGRSAWLWLWTTNRYLRDAFAVAEAWGFPTYRQIIVWRKTGNPSPFGGTIAPTHAEFALIFSRGSPRVVARAGTSVIDAPKQPRHSQKPAALLDVVESALPGPYVELFARAPRLGWDSWGHGYEMGATG